MLRLVPDIVPGVNTTHPNTTLSHPGSTNSTHFLEGSPLGESLHALADSGILNLLIAVSEYIILFIIAYPLDVALLLSMIEDTKDNFQSATKKTDEKQDEIFATERRVQEAYSKATSENPNPNPKQVAITGSLRRVLRYLAYLGGAISIWRGVLLPWISQTLEDKMVDFAQYLTTNVGWNSKSPYMLAPLGILISMIQMPLQLAWIHHVITHRPSTSHGYIRGITAWRRYISNMMIPRLPSRIALKGMLIPTLTFSVIEQAARFYPGSFAYTYILKPLFGSSVGGTHMRSLLAIAYFAETTTTTAGLWALSYVGSTAYTRVAASLLPDDVQTVVPMDRSFGVKGRRLQKGVSWWQAITSLQKGTIWRATKLYVEKEALNFLLITCFSISVAVVDGLTPGYHMDGRDEFSFTNTADLNSK